MEYLHSDITGETLRAFYDVYNELRYGFLERVYKNTLYKEPLRATLFDRQNQPKPFVKKLIELAP